MPQPKEHAFYVDRHHLIKHIFIVLMRRREATFNSGIVVKAVDGSILFKRDLDIVLHFGGSGDVGGDKV